METKSVMRRFNRRRFFFINTCKLELIPMALKHSFLLNRVFDTEYDNLCSHNSVR
jgi:hypothetical protein